MAKEIERKFLVADVDAVRASAFESVRIRQGYLSVEPQRTVRVRVRGNKGFLTVKGINHAIERMEWEYEIPVSDALEMLAICSGKIIDKTRRLIAYEGHIWEVDEFHLPVEMWIAEVELAAIDESVMLPSWVGAEVSGNPDYYNSNLVK